LGNHWETAISLSFCYKNQYIAHIKTIRLDFILLFGHIHISNSTKLYIFAQFGPLKLGYVFLLEYKLPIILTYALWAMKACIRDDTTTKTHEIRIKKFCLKVQ